MNKNFNHILKMFWQCFNHFRKINIIFLIRTVNEYEQNMAISKKNRLRNAEFKLKVLTPCVDLLQ